MFRHRLSSRTGSVNGQVRQTAVSLATICCFALAIDFLNLQASGAIPVSAQEISESTNTEPDETGLVQFSFSGTPWREVISWLADEAGLAIYTGDLPTGSLTYSDPNSYTPTEAISRINLFLLPQGYTLIQSRGMLSVINLGDPRGLQQLDTLASTVTSDQLEDLDDHEVVRCFFSLGEINAEDAAEELASLRLITTPTVFERTNRLMITDTTAKLRTVKLILDAFEPTTLRDGTVAKTFMLEHAHAEDILNVVRPHLGLATGEMIGIDVSLSSDPTGDVIFVTGVEDKVTLIENLIEDLDVRDDSLSTENGTAELRSHSVPGGNVEVVYNVLLTLLAGKSVRLSMDETAETIVALATPEIQEEIARTVTELEAAQEEFAVIPLESADPLLVVSLLEEMLDIPDPIFDDPEDEGYNHDAPKIDADPGNRRLFVTGKPNQIEQVRKIVEQLESSDQSQFNDSTSRLISLRGRSAEEVLRLAARYWPRDNLIILMPTAAEAYGGSTERVVAEQIEEARQRELNSQPNPPATGKVIAGDIRSRDPAIECQRTEDGLLIQSEDTDALDVLQSDLQTIIGSIEQVPLPPIVFYLRYARPNEALRMLSEMLDGKSAALENPANTLIIGGSTTGSSFFGSLISTSDGTMTLTADTLTVVADSRLNRLIAQGTESDIEQVEAFLKVIDKDVSLTSIETYGRSHVIELQHARAAEVAITLREAFADRVSGIPGRGNPGQQGGDPRQGQRPQQRREEAQERDGNQERRGEDPRQGEGRGRPQQAPSFEPKMTIAVHEPSNSLIVTAQDQLFREVEQLVREIDARNEQVMQIIPVGDSHAFEAIESVLGPQTQSNEGGIGDFLRQEIDRRDRDSNRSRNQDPRRSRPPTQRDR